MKTQLIFSERQTRLAVIFTAVLIAVALLLVIAARSDASARQASEPATRTSIK